MPHVFVVVVVNEENRAKGEKSLYVQDINEKKKKVAQVVDTRMVRNGWIVTLVEPSHRPYVCRTLQSNKISKMCPHSQSEICGGHVDKRRYAQRQREGRRCGRHCRLKKLISRSKKRNGKFYWSQIDDYNQGAASQKIL